MSVGISKKQFDLLSAIAVEKETISQRKLAKKTGYSLATVNKVMQELTELQWLSNGAVSSAGLETLEPFRVQRAVILAAGFGSRLVPLTFNTPKPLVRVNGKRIIDTLIDACLANGIEDIYIVRGYLGEQFDQLLYQYPNLHFLDNRDFNITNNISSAVCAAHLLAGAYVMEADLLLRNPALLPPYHYESNYLGIKTERTDDWCFTLKRGYIDSWRIGGVDCYQEVGVSFWSADDGERLGHQLRECYEMPGGKEQYWDYVPLVQFRQDYRIAVRECQFSDIVEIDTFNELKKVDPSYDVI